MKQFGFKPEEVDAINGCFSQYSAIEKVILYGSRAKGNFKKASDIDLTLIDNQLSISDMSSLENQLNDLLLPYKIDLSLKRQITNPDMLDHINRVGVEFYKKTSIP